MVSRRFAAGKRQYKRSRQNPIPVRCQGAGKEQAKKRVHRTFPGNAALIFKKK
jgi:hypothetical protein